MITHSREEPLSGFSFSLSNFHRGSIALIALVVVDSTRHDDVRFQACKNKIFYVFINKIYIYKTKQTIIINLINL